MKREVQESRDRIMKFKAMVEGMEEGTLEKVEEVRKEKEELLEINEYIVSQSQELAGRLSRVEQERQEMVIRCEEMVKEREHERKKQKKEIENIKLMHAQ